MRALVLTALATLLAAAPASAAVPGLWPPRGGAGHFFVHYGEEHWNDVDGTAVLTQVVADTIRFRPDLVTMSGDKANDGRTSELEEWKRIMGAYDRAGIPYMAGVGNHDGKQATPEQVTDEQGGATPLRDITFYKEVFASRPYPMGDAAPYPIGRMGPRERPADDPPGASTHYYVDYGGARFVFLDSSCYGIINCDPVQSPPDGKGRSQYEFLRDAAAEANAAGRALFIVTHMPTRDPRDQEHTGTIYRNHVMGKGTSPDVVTLEAEAQAAGVDAVLLGHIKGVFQYVGHGGVPYYIDGGAGGELYTSGPRGVDHGYWYGWRTLRVDGGKIVETDMVPVIVPGGITIQGPGTLSAGGEAATWQAFARQPATKSDRAVVEKLELRDPNPTPRPAQAGGVPPLLIWTAPLLALALCGLLARVPAPRRPRALAPGMAVLLVVPLGVAGLAGAQDSEPTSTPREALPNPARVWTSSDPLVLAPVASDTDDPRREAATQTADGRFAAVCPGRATLSITAGVETASTAVHVRSGAGRIVRSLRRGRGRTVATLRLAQAGIVEALIKRRGQPSRNVIVRSCRPAGTIRVRRPRTARRGDVVTVRVRSDQKTVSRRYRLR